MDKQKSRKDPVKSKKNKDRERERDSEEAERDAKPNSSFHQYNLRKRDIYNRGLRLPGKLASPANDTRSPCTLGWMDLDTGACSSCFPAASVSVSECCWLVLNYFPPSPSCGCLRRDVYVVTTLNSYSHLSPGLAYAVLLAYGNPFFLLPVYGRSKGHRQACTT